MMQHKDDDYTAAGFAGCFLLYKNKKKIKGISKIQHIKRRTKKRSQKWSRTEKKGEAWKYDKEGEMKNERYTK